MWRAYTMTPMELLYITAHTMSDMDSTGTQLDPGYVQRLPYARTTLACPTMHNVLRCRRGTRRCVASRQISQPLSIYHTRLVESHKAARRTR